VILIGASRKTNVAKRIKHILWFPDMLSMLARFAILRATTVFYYPYEPHRGDDIEGLSAAIAFIMLLFAICWPLMNQLRPWPEAVPSPDPAATTAHGIG
jgi:hypothetical protein